jgi:demethylmenaquinone methyltransferase/2-methoxy-6-polyprenyl-1,4-benzoquinol methylase
VGLRYGRVATAYDVTSLEWPVYRVGRVAAIRDLGLRPGDRVLDVGCGTGLSFPLLRQAVGPHGAVVGVDSGDVLLGQARRRLRRHAWANVRAVRGDAGQLPAEVMDAGPFDAVLAVYVLSIVDDWPQAWEQMLAAVRPGGRVAVVDLALPEGPWAWTAPAAWLACRVAGSDPHRQPWRQLEATASGVEHRVLRGGHVHVVTGVLPG